MQNKTPFSPGSRICLYARDSGGSDQDLSIQQQIDELKNWCNENGYIPSKIFTDEARSGSSAIGRLGFQEMMTHFRNKAQEKGVVIWSYSRFAREIDDAAFYKADLRKRGYVIFSITDSIPEGLDGRLFESIIEWKDARYLEDLSRDIKRGQKHLIERYGAVPGRPPKGFIREPVYIGERRDGSEHVVHRWVPDPEILPLIRKAFEMRATGKTYKQIHDETHLHPMKSGYARLFTNRIFIGELHFGDTVILDYCEPVIEKKLWDAVQAVHKTRNVFNDPQHPRRISSSFILSGIIFCDLCGGIMNGHVITDRHGGRYTYYRCKRRGLRWDCDARHVPQKALEDAVLDEMKEHILTPDNLEEIQEEARQLWQENRGKKDIERNRLNRQITTLSRKMANLTNAIVDTGGSRTLLDKLQELERREAELMFQLAGIEEKPDPILDLDTKELSDYIILALDPANKGINELLRNLIHRIEVKRKGMTIKGMIYYYSPVDAYRSAGRREETYKHKLRVKI